MMKISEYKKYYKNIILVVIFSLLLISITKNATEIYTVSSSQKITITVPIIMYHQVKNNGLGKDVISPYEFETDLQYLSENNYTTITMFELIDYVYNDEELPPNPIILSFDDGYLSTYKNVFPLLQKYNMKIVLSIVGKSVDDFSKVVDNNIEHAHLTWNQINEMEQSGLVEIQNHTYNMHKIFNGRYGCGQKNNESLTNYEKVITEDVLTFQERLQTMLEILPSTFTYPYGKYNDNTDQILKKLGYKATLSCSYGVNLINKDPEKLFGLKRMCRAHDHNINKLIKEGMETLKYIKE
ncbi:MAG: polysaccharide deacetylase family protein [Herbinix sp.]|nr:polysaccharide deacetylase family protein [Herbinix sp.]